MSLPETPAAATNPDKKISITDFVQDGNISKKELSDLYKAKNEAKDKAKTIITDATKYDVDKLRQTSSASILKNWLTLSKQESSFIDNILQDNWCNLKWRKFDESLNDAQKVAEDKLKELKKNKSIDPNQNNKWIIIKTDLNDKNNICGAMIDVKTPNSLPKKFDVYDANDNRKIWYIELGKTDKSYSFVWSKFLARWKIDDIKNVDNYNTDGKPYEKKGSAAAPDKPAEPAKKETKEKISFSEKFLEKNAQAIMENIDNISTKDAAIWKELKNLFEYDSKGITINLDKSQITKIQNYLNTNNNKNNKIEPVDGIFWKDTLGALKNLNTKIQQKPAAPAAPVVAPVAAPEALKLQKTKTEAVKQTKDLAREIINTLWYSENLSRSSGITEWWTIDRLDKAVNKITDKITDKINAETDLTKITNQISNIKKDLPAIEKRRMELGSGDTFKDMDKAKLEEELVKRFEDLTK